MSPKKAEPFSAKKLDSMERRNSIGTQLGIPKVSNEEMLAYCHNVLDSGLDNILP
jgi:hypothetical protein